MHGGPAALSRAPGAAGPRAVAAQGAEPWQQAQHGAGGAARGAPRDRGTLRGRAGLRRGRRRDSARARARLRTRIAPCRDPRAAYRPARAALGPPSRRPGPDLGPLPPRRGDRGPHERHSARPVRGPPTPPPERPSGPRPDTVPGPRPAAPSRPLPPGPAYMALAAALGPAAPRPLSAARTPSPPSSRQPPRRQGGRGTAPARHTLPGAEPRRSMQIAAARRPMRDGGGAGATGACALPPCGTRGSTHGPRLPPSAHVRAGRAPPAPPPPPSLPAPPASPRTEHREQRLEHPQFSSFLILKEARLSTCSRHRGLGQP